VGPEGALLGWGGRVSPRTLDLPAWAGDVWAIEVRLPSSPRPPDQVRYAPLPTHPGVERDLALLVPDTREMGAVLALVNERGGPHLREAGVFDVYRGEGVPRGFRSVAVRLHFRAQDRTLKDQEVDEVVRTLTRALEEELDVGLRGSQG